MNNTSSSTSDLLASTEKSLSTEATQKVNAFTRYWSSINWDNFVDTFLSKALTLFFTCILFFLLRKIGTRLIVKAFENYNKKSAYSENRIITLQKLCSNVFQYTLLFFFLYSLLTIIGIPVGSLLAGAGIAGVAIGLGAQGFINDIITGFVIIMEKQMEVGDHVKIDAIEGNVLSVGLRTTTIKSADGTLHFIPNRSILIISNFSRSNMRVLIDVRVNAGEDTQAVTKILEKVHYQLVPRYDSIKSGPDILGLVDLGNGNFAIRVIMYTLNGSQYEIQRDFLAAYITALTEANITIPNSPINLV